MRVRFVKAVVDRSAEHSHQVGDEIDHPDAHMLCRPEIGVAEPVDEEAIAKHAEFLEVLRGWEEKRAAKAERRAKRFGGKKL